MYKNKNHPRNIDRKRLAVKKRRKFNSWPSNCFHSIFIVDTFTFELIEQSYIGETLNVTGICFVIDKIKLYVNRIYFPGKKGWENFIDLKIKIPLTIIDSSNV